MDLNFDGKIGKDIFKISDERAIELHSILAEAAMDIALNIKDYVFKSDQLNGSSANHTGKILQRMLRDITSENERLFVIYTTDGAITIINQSAILYELTNELKNINK